MAITTRAVTNQKRALPDPTRALSNQTRALSTRPVLGDGPTRVVKFGARKTLLAPREAGLQLVEDGAKLLYDYRYYYYTIFGKWRYLVQYVLLQLVEHGANPLRG